MLPFSPKLSLISLILLLFLVISGVIGIGASLLLGIAYALLIGNQFQLKTHWASGIILKGSVVALGFGLNFVEVMKTAQGNFPITAISIVFTLVLGYFLGKMLKVEQKLSLLIAGGTAICGGSAIAAFAPAIQAKPNHVIVSISIIFLLNAVGLLIYPEIGKILSLSQREFGLWSALGIHDTSSVVGAAAIYGEESMHIATTTKLARALWIIPLVFIASLTFRHQKTLFSIPLFIVLFLLASLLASFVPIFANFDEQANFIAKKGMAISLFLIGAGFSKETLSGIQWSALWQGLILWILVSIFSLWLIKIL